MAEEHGLKVGDQILDVNGHSFLSILHQEAVAIFRSYPTLIMTIKVWCPVQDCKVQGLICLNLNYQVCEYQSFVIHIMHTHSLWEDFQSWLVMWKRKRKKGTRREEDLLTCSQTREPWKVSRLHHLLFLSFNNHLPLVSFSLTHTHSHKLPPSFLSHNKKEPH